MSEEVKLAHTFASEYQHREDPTVKHESENNRRLSYTKSDMKQWNRDSIRITFLI